MCNLLEWDDDGEKLQVASLALWEFSMKWKWIWDAHWRQLFACLTFDDCVQEVKLLIKLVSGVNKNKQRSSFFTFRLPRRLSYSSLVSSIIKRTKERQTKKKISTCRACTSNTSLWIINENCVIWCEFSLIIFGEVFLSLPLLKYSIAFSERYYDDNKKDVYVGWGKTFSFLSVLHNFIIIWRFFIFHARQKFVV